MAVTTFDLPLHGVSAGVQWWEGGKDLIGVLWVLLGSDAGNGCESVLGQQRDGGIGGDGFGESEANFAGGTADCTSWCWCDFVGLAVGGEEEG